MATAESRRRGGKAALVSPSGARICGPSRCGPSRTPLGWVTAPLLKTLLPNSREPSFLPAQSTPPECAQGGEVPTPAPWPGFCSVSLWAKVGPSSDKRVPAKERKTRGDFSGPQRYWGASTALCGFCLHAQFRVHTFPGCAHTDLCTWVGDTRVGTLVFRYCSGNPDFFSAVLTGQRKVTGCGG